MRGCVLGIDGSEGYSAAAPIGMEYTDPREVARSSVRTWSACLRVFGNPAVSGHVAERFSRAAARQSPLMLYIQPVE